MLSLVTQQHLYSLNPGRRASTGPNISTCDFYLVYLFKHCVIAYLIQSSSMASASTDHDIDIEAQQDASQPRRSETPNINLNQSEHNNSPGHASTQAGQEEIQTEGHPGVYFRRNWGGLDTHAKGMTRNSA